MKVFLGIPSAGTHVTESLNGILVCTKEHDVMYDYAVSSNLCYNFNLLWCHMLKQEVDYFAMLHADIEVPSFWIDTLIEKMGDNDVLSVFSPIKDNTNRTSTALQGKDKVTNILCSDVGNYPEIITEEITGEKLLINTGCMLVKVGEWCKHFPGFTVENRIEHGVPRTVTEDWLFSNWCNKKGLKVAATSAINLTHYGLNGWTIANE